MYVCMYLLRLILKPTPADFSEIWWSCTHDSGWMETPNLTAYALYIFLQQEFRIRKKILFLLRHNLH